MKKIAFLLAFFLPLYSISQVTCTAPANGTILQDIIETHFLGEGVTVSDVRFNSSLTLNSNQFGTFVNPDTSGNNIKLKKGIVIVNGNIQDAEAGASAIHSSTSNPPSNGDEVSTPLTDLLRGQGNTNSLNDVGALRFKFVPEGEQVSFKYVFASDEYPGYVCSQFNDAFGFFISGPYLPNGTPANLPGYEQYRNTNIAIIPGSDPELPVTINTINTTTQSSTSTCVTTNGHLHIQQPSGSTINKMQGYTIALDTKKVPVAPCYEYRIEIAICDVSDAIYNSCVFLGANSFKSDSYKLSVANVGDTQDTLLVKTKCSSTNVSVKLNRPANNDDTYTIQTAGNMVEGVDYQFAAGGRTMTFTQGDTVANLTINFLNNPADVEGQIDSLKIIGQYLSECAPIDTITIFTIVPPLLKFDTIVQDTLYCKNGLPHRRLFFAKTKNELQGVAYKWTSNGEPIGETPNQANNFIMIPDNITEMTVTVTANDSCGREISHNIFINVNTGVTNILFDKDKICEGDSIILSFENPEDVSSCLWQSQPADLRLSQNNTAFNAVAMPAATTRYYLTIDDKNGCQARDTVIITAYPNVKASLSITPKKLTFSKAEAQFIDQTFNSFTRAWNFGDGTTSTDKQGYHTFPNTEEATFEVVLVAYNEAMCPDTAKAIVIMKPDFGIYLPNAFTPGSGDRNSIFIPYSSQEVDYEFAIYNRWGEEIFFTKEKKGWDGKQKDGNYVQDGTYIWVLTFRDGNGVLQRKKGTVNTLKQ